jgi:Na+-driven multidrug efflux pump
MDQIFGWDTAGGLGILLAGLGVFFWGLQFVSREFWRGGRWTRREESKK